LLFADVIIYKVTSPVRAGALTAQSIINLPQVQNLREVVSVVKPKE